MAVKKIEINVNEAFPLLGHAPITEAVLEIRSRSDAPWDEGALISELETKLPDYPKRQSRRDIQQTFKIEQGKAPEHTVDDLGWTGFSLRSEDEKQIAQFQRDIFSFSRLQPYEKWHNFVAEALRLWTVYRGLAQRTEVQRVGLRFVNQIRVPFPNFEIDDYLVTGPRDIASLPLPFATFFYQDTLAVPDSPYAINVTRTIQPPVVDTVGRVLILDIDVVRGPFELTETNLESSLAEMRWLKNKLFFGSVTEKTLTLLK